MTFAEILKPRYGLTHDPNWAKYHQWPWDYFPVRLPACTVYRTQTSTGTAETGRICWEIERGVPIVARLARPDGRLLAEVVSEVATGGKKRPGDREFLRRAFTLGAAELAGLMGFGFEWVFSLPLNPPGTLQPWHPLGAVRVDGAELLGAETIIAIHAGGRVTPAHAQESNPCS